jgi:intraflagellar transport protein 172
MQLKYYQTILPPNQGIVKVTALCWSPNGKKLAVCTTDRVVLLFDETGAKKDKFSTKPVDKVRLLN